MMNMKWVRRVAQRALTILSVVLIVLTAIVLAGVAVVHNDYYKQLEAREAQKADKSQ